MKFTTALHKVWFLEKINKYDYKITEEFVWFLNYENKKEAVIVEKWFITNFWTIPFFCKNYLNYKSLSYVLHDYCYSKEARIILINSWIKINITRYEADIILFNSLWVEWMIIYKRVLIFIFVRIFWIFFYQKS